jgi:hypothetical protein
MYFSISLTLKTDKGWVSCIQACPRLLNQKYPGLPK